LLFEVEFTLVEFVVFVVVGVVVFAVAFVVGVVGVGPGSITTA
jgi:hypothetical protein